VELAKKQCGYREATGDWFAAIVPLAVALGRVGCLLRGCCLGIACAPAWYTIRDPFGQARWPAVPVEMGFNLLCAGVFLWMRRRHVLTGQHFHVYLMAYGVFRFGHEYLRDPPRVAWGLSGYQVGAAGCFVLGVWGYLRRRKSYEGYMSVEYAKNA
jgi:phosphatidylglycerol:prolipoprotein diacylglycerol transferase